MEKITSRYLNSDGEFVVRCSALGDVMASPDNLKLSVGAKSYVKKAFKETYWKYDKIIEGAKLDKGIFMEEKAIELIAKYYGEPYVKNEEKRTNSFIIGTCDIAYDNKIRDVKCSWSKDTFPIQPEDAKSSKYEWQGRAYMMLWNKEEFHLDYCLMDTPKTLIPVWESNDLHLTNGLSIEQRITTLSFMRDLKKEKQIIQRVEGCRIYWNELKKYFKIK